MITKAVAAGRLKKLQERLEDDRLDGVVIVPGPNMQYFTGVNSILLERPFILLVPTDGEPELIAPALEAGPYARSPLKIAIHSWTDSQGSGGAIGKATKAAGVRGKWGAEGKVPFLFLSKLMKRASAKFKDAEPVLQGLREIKDKEEEGLLKKSAAILSKSFRKIPGVLKEGVTEAWLAKEVTETVYANGATRVDAMLVQSGGRAADPHALPSSKKVMKGESIIFDVGTTYEGYYADITRTFVIGGDGAVEKVYSKVLEAEERGIDTAAEGVRVGDVDGAARNTLKKAGYGKYFIHRTGHGLGLEVHEAPYIVEGGREKLRGGMCFTVEPGVYMTGKLGVRIEDDVFIEGKMGKQITDVPKEFGWWK